MHIRIDITNGNFPELEKIAVKSPPTMDIMPRFTILGMISFLLKGALGLIRQLLVTSTVRANIEPLGIYFSQSVGCPKAF